MDGIRATTTTNAGAVGIHISKKTAILMRTILSWRVQIKSDVLKTFP
jgi:hypothetical protein